MLIRKEHPKRHWASRMSPKEQRHRHLSYPDERHRGRTVYLLLQPLRGRPPCLHSHTWRSRTKLVAGLRSHKEAAGPPTGQGRCSVPTTAVTDAGGRGTHQQGELLYDKLPDISPSLIHPFSERELPNLRPAEACTQPHVCTHSGTTEPSLGKKRPEEISKRRALLAFTKSTMAPDPSLHYSPCPHPERCKNPVDTE